MVASYASDTTQDNSIKVLLDGKYLQFNEPPVEMNGSTLVPMRDIFEALGATLSWDDSTSTATGAKGTTKVILQLDNPTAYINDEPITLSVPGTLVNNKTMVPTRFIAESMNCVVSWDEGTKTVIIVPDKIIEFDDENLEKAIKIAINSNKYKLNVSDVASLQSLIANDSKISNLNGLQYLIGLNTLSLNKNEIKDISPLSSLLKLKSLNISDNSISNITPLKSLQNLKSLNIGNNNIDDITSLSNHTKLESLYMNKNKISDISALKSIPNLKTIIAYYTLIDDLSPLNSLEDLEVLNICETQVIDISPLKECSKLTTLNIYQDAILDLSPLKLLKKLNTLYYENVKNKTEINEELFAKSATLVNKGKNIINKIITPDMSDLEKELAIHDYIILHSKYDTEGVANNTISNDSHMPYGVLVDGLGVCDGYSNAMKALLNMVNIKSLTVYGNTFKLSSSSTGHAWNLVNLYGKYYMVDLTWDDNDYISTINTISHKYLNLSSKQISVNHKFDMEFYPEANTDNKDYDKTNQVYHYTVFAGDNIYTCESGNLYKIDAKTQTSKLLCQDKVKEISYYGDWIYYINKTDGDKIYKIKPDGSQNSLVCKDSALYLYTLNNQIFYIENSSDGRRLHSIDLDGNNKLTLTSESITSTLYISDGMLYFKVYSFYSKDSHSKFMKSDLSGKNSKVLVNESLGGFSESSDSSSDRVSFTFTPLESINGDWVYYINANNENRIYKVKKDGTEITKISPDSIYNNTYHIIGDWIYYVNATDSHKIYRVKLDGTQNSLVE